MKVLIVDYGMGNIKSISSTLNYIGIEDIVYSNNYEDFKSADKIILPGVGSFALAMKNIKEHKIDIFINEVAMELQKPILGICLGMQLLGGSSNEDTLTEGIGIIEGEVSRFKEYGNLKIPHVGFNQIQINSGSKLFHNFKANPDFYFTHSYRMNSEIDVCASHCFYGDKFIASFEQKNVAGVQFHPELSQKNGIAMLNNFIDLF